MIATLASPAETACFGQRLAAALSRLGKGAVIHLLGDLGAGKTALTRAVLASLGYSGAVVSPSYTLIETYELGERSAHHLDLYRISDPQELEFLGVRELSSGNDLVFVEWAQHGAGFLPDPDLEIILLYNAIGRDIDVRPHSGTGEAIVALLREDGL